MKLSNLITVAILAAVINFNEASDIPERDEQSVDQLLEEVGQHGHQMDNGVKEKRCPEFDSILGAVSPRFSLPSLIIRRDVHDTFQKRNCDRCLSICKKSGNCNFCDTFCKVREIQKSNDETVGLSPRMGETGLSESEERYYTVGSFGPGPTQSLFLRMLNLPKKINPDRLVVLARSKAKTQKGESHPVIIDTAHVFSRNDGQPAELELELHGVKNENEDLGGLTERLNKELDTAFDTKKEMMGDSRLTADEIDKIIDHAVSQHTNQIANPNQVVGSTSNFERVGDPQKISPNLNRFMPNNEEHLIGAGEAEQRGVSSSMSLGSSEEFRSANEENLENNEKNLIRDQVLGDAPEMDDNRDSFFLHKLKKKKKKHGFEENEENFVGATAPEIINDEKNGTLIRDSNQDANSKIPQESSPAIASRNKFEASTLPSETNEENINPTTVEPGKTTSEHVGLFFGGGGPFGGAAPWGGGGWGGPGPGYGWGGPVFIDHHHFHHGHHGHHHGHHDHHHDHHHFHHGGGHGFGPGFGPGIGPGIGPGFGPGIGPGFGPYRTAEGDQSSKETNADSVQSTPDEHMNTGDNSNLQHGESIVGSSNIQNGMDIKNANNQNGINVDITKFPKHLARELNVINDQPITTNTRAGGDSSDFSKIPKEFPKHLARELNFNNDQPITTNTRAGGDSSDFSKIPKEFPKHLARELNFNNDQPINTNTQTADDFSKIPEEFPAHLAREINNHLDRPSNDDSTNFSRVPKEFPTHLAREFNRDQPLNPKGQLAESGYFSKFPMEFPNHLARELNSNSIQPINPNARANEGIELPNIPKLIEDEEMPTMPKITDEVDVLGTFKTFKKQKLKNKLFHKKGGFGHGFGHEFGHGFGHGHGFHRMNSDEDEDASSGTRYNNGEYDNDQVINIPMNRPSPPSSDNHYGVQPADAQTLYQQMNAYKPISTSGAYKAPNYQAAAQKEEYKPTMESSAYDAPQMNHYAQETKDYSGYNQPSGGMNQAGYATQEYKKPSPSIYAKQPVGPSEYAAEPSEYGTKQPVGPSGYATQPSGYNTKQPGFAAQASGYDAKPVEPSGFGAQLSGYGTKQPGYSSEYAAQESIVPSGYPTQETIKPTMGYPTKQPAAPPAQQYVAPQAMAAAKQPNSYKITSYSPPSPGINPSLYSANAQKPNGNPQAAGVYQNPQPVYGAYQQEQTLPQQPINQYEEQKMPSYEQSKGVYGSYKPLVDEKPESYSKPEVISSGTYQTYKPQPAVMEQYGQKGQAAYDYNAQKEYQSNYEQQSINEQPKGFGSNYEQYQGYQQNEDAPVKGYQQPPMGQNNYQQGYQQPTYKQGYQQPNFMGYREEEDELPLYSLVGPNGPYNNAQGEIVGATNTKVIGKNVDNGKESSSKGNEGSTSASVSEKDQKRLHIEGEDVPQKNIQEFNKDTQKIVDSQRKPTLSPIKEDPNEKSLDSLEDESNESSLRKLAARMQEPKPEPVLGSQASTEAPKTAEEAEAWYKQEYHKLKKWVEDKFGGNKEADNKNLVNRFTDIIKNDLAEGVNITNSTSKAMEAKISKLIEDNLGEDGGKGVDTSKKLEKIENLVETTPKASPERVGQAHMPNSGLIEQQPTTEEIPDSTVGCSLEKLFGDDDDDDGYGYGYGYGNGGGHKKKDKFDKFGIFDKKKKLKKLKGKILDKFKDKFDENEGEYMPNYPQYPGPYVMPMGDGYRSAKGEPILKDLDKLLHPVKNGELIPGIMKNLEKMRFNLPTLPSLNPVKTTTENTYEEENEDNHLDDYTPVHENRNGFKENPESNNAYAQENSGQYAVNENQYVPQNDNQFIPQNQFVPQNQFIPQNQNQYAQNYNGFLTGNPNQNYRNSMPFNPSQQPPNQILGMQPRLQTSFSADPSHLGKLIPQSSKPLNIHNRDVSEQLNNENMFFIGDGMKIPVTLKKRDDGSLYLSVDMKALCKCDKKGCSDCNKEKGKHEKRSPRIDEDNSLNQYLVQKNIDKINEYIERNQNTFKKYLQENPEDFHKYIQNKLDLITKNMVRERNTESKIENSAEDAYVLPVKSFYKAQIKDKVADLNDDVKKYEENEEKTMDVTSDQSLEEPAKKPVDLISSVLSWMKDLAMDESKH